MRVVIALVLCFCVLFASATPAVKKVHYSAATGSPRSILLSKPHAAPTVNGVESYNVRSAAVESFFQMHPDYGIEDVSTQLELLGTTPDLHDKSVTTARFQQVVNGIPVLGADLKIMFTAAGEILSVHGVTVPDAVDMDVSAAISATDAMHATNHHLLSTGVSPSADSITHQAEPTLKVFRDGLTEDVSGANTLVYECLVRDPFGSHSVYVDAVTGDITETMLSKNSVFSFDAFDNADNVLFNETWNTEWDRVIDATEKVDSLFNAMFDLDLVAMSDYDTFELQQLECGTFGNPWTLGELHNSLFADYDAGRVSWCKGFGFRDIIGHEWGHAYTEQLDGLLYNGQAGALNEHFSDIVGELLDIIADDQGYNMRVEGQCLFEDETGRWCLGDEYSKLHTPNALSYISDVFEPSCTQGDSKPEHTADIICAVDDNGGVHSNSGIPNFVFSHFVDRQPEGVGVTKAFHIYVRAKDTCQTSSSTFAQHATCLQASCDYLMSSSVNLRGPDGTISGERVSQADCEYLSSLLDEVAMSVDDPCGAAGTPFSVGYQYPVVFPENPVDAYTSIHVQGPDSVFIYCKIGDYVKSILSPGPGPGRVVNCPVPAFSVHESGEHDFPVSVSLTGEDGSWSTEPLRVYYYKNPAITAVEPSSGPVTQPTWVIVYGLDFQRNYGCTSASYEANEALDDCLIVLLHDEYGNDFLIEGSDIELIDSTMLNITIPEAADLSLSALDTLEFSVSLNGAQYFRSLNYFTYRHESAMTDITVELYGRNGSDGVHDYIGECALNIQFDEDVLDYECDATGDVYYAKILYTKKEESANVVLKNNLKLLNTGYHLLEVKSTSSDGGSISDYQILLNRAYSVDATLANMTLSYCGIEVDPADQCDFGGFDPDNHFNYDCTVPFETECVEIRPVTRDSGAYFTISAPYLEPGLPTSYFVSVFSEEYAETEVKTATEVYTLSITRALNFDSELADLHVTGGCELFPPFQEGVFNYSCTTIAEKITITPTLKYPDGQFAQFADGEELAYRSSAVLGGNFHHLVQVNALADNGDVDTGYQSLYNITITYSQSADETNGQLGVVEVYRDQVLALDGGAVNLDVESFKILETMTPPFSPDIYDYVIYVHNDVVRVSLTSYKLMSGTDTDPSSLASVLFTWDDVGENDIASYADPHTIKGRCERVLCCWDEDCPGRCSSSPLSRDCSDISSSDDVCDFFPGFPIGTETCAQQAMCCEDEGCTVSECIPTYNFVMIRNTTKAEDSRLKFLESLECPELAVDPSLSAEDQIYNFNCTVPYSTGSIVLYALPHDNDVHIDGFDRPTVLTVPIEIQYDLVAGEYLTINMSMLWYDAPASLVNGTDVYENLNTTYTVTVYRELHNDDQLSMMDVDGGCELRPPFKANIKTGYKCQVPFETSSVDATGTPLHDDATVVFPDTTALEVGVPTLVNITVFAHNGIDSSTYSVEVTRAEEDNAFIGDISAGANGDDYPLVPEFNPEILEYYVYVPSNSTQGQVSYVLGEASQTVSVGSNGDFLFEGDNVFEILVVAKDDITFNLYFVHIVVVDDNANLVSLAFPESYGCDMDPVFSTKETLYYCMNLLIGVTEIENITYEASSFEATVEISGNTNLRTGMNLVTVIVTASNGVTVKAYNVLFFVDDDEINECDPDPCIDGETCNDLIWAYECDPNSGRRLLSEDDVEAVAPKRQLMEVSIYPVLELMIDPPCTLNPPFYPQLGLTNPTFACTVPAGTEQAVISTVMADDATLAFTPSDTLDLTAGQSTKVEILSTHNGEDYVYTIYITRPLNDNSYLSSLTVTDCPDLVFDKNVYNYSCNVYPDVDTFSLSYEIEDPSTAYAEVEYLPADAMLFFNDVAYGRVLVTAEDLSWTEYLVEVRRTLDDRATILEFDVQECTLEPSFNTTIEDYDCAIASDVDTIGVDVLLDSTFATFSMTGHQGLKTGTNDVSFTTLSQDGTFSDEVNMFVIRAADPAATDVSTLNSLDLDFCTLDRRVRSDDIDLYYCQDDFDNDYRAFTYTAVPSDNDASVTINDGDDFLPLFTSNLTVRVTSENGNNVTEYKVQVTREASSNALLSMFTSDSSSCLISDFDPAEDTYSCGVPFETEQFDLSVETDDDEATYTIPDADGVTVSVEPGIPKEITVRVVASDLSTIGEYYLTVTRDAADTDSTLSALTLSGCELDFDPQTFTYYCAVATGVESVTSTCITTADTSTCADSTTQLALGVNTASVTVTSQFGSTATYRVFVTRFASHVIPSSSDPLEAEILLCTFPTEFDVTDADAVRNFSQVLMQEFDQLETEITGRAAVAAVQAGASGGVELSLAVLPANLNSATEDDVTTARDAFIARLSEYATFGTDINEEQVFVPFFEENPGALMQHIVNAVPTSEGRLTQSYLVCTNDYYRGLEGCYNETSAVVDGGEDGAATLFENILGSDFGLSEDYMQYAVLAVIFILICVGIGCCYKLFIAEDGDDEMGNQKHDRLGDDFDDLNKIGDEVQMETLGRATIIEGPSSEQDLDISVDSNAEMNTSTDDVEMAIP